MSEFNSIGAIAADVMPVGMKPASGFNFENCARNSHIMATAGKSGAKMPTPMSTGCVASRCASDYECCAVPRLLCALLLALAHL